jgi:hypothetical protein
VADAFAVKIDVGLLDDADLVELGHGEALGWVGCKEGAIIHAASRASARPARVPARRRSNLPKPPAQRQQQCGPYACRFREAGASKAAFPTWRLGTRVPTALG